MTIQSTMSAQAVSIDLLGHERSIPGTIKSLADRSIHLDVAHHVQPKSRVRVVFSEDYSAQGQVLFSNPCGDAHTIGVLLEGRGIEELRSERRLPVNNEPATVTLLDGLGRERIPARAQDVSRSGLGLRVDRRVSTGVWVKVELGRMLILGEVRHCSPRSADEYHLGLAAKTVVHRTQN
jgi:hypothetical protein